MLRQENLRAACGLRQEESGLKSARKRLSQTLAGNPRLTAGTRGSWDAFCSRLGETSVRELSLAQCGLHPEALAVLLGGARHTGPQGSPCAGPSERVLVSAAPALNAIGSCLVTLSRH